MYTALVLATLSFAASGLAASLCTGLQYNDVPSFGFSSGCYPLGYSSTVDLGQTNPDDASTRCNQKCADLGSACGMTVAQLNKAADSNLYSGTCFFYSPANIPAGPRRCGDKAYLLQAYMRDNTNNCFSSSASAASTFCSSYLSIPVSTVSKTATSTPPVVTVTATSTSTPTIISTTTTTVTPRVTISSSTLVTTTVATVPVTVTVPAFAFTTSTTTVTSTVTSTGFTAKKRGLEVRVTSTVPPPACVTSDTPSTRLSAACSCISVKTSTTTTTVTTTLVPVSSTTTSITTIPVTSTTTVTISNPAVSTTVTGTTLVSVTASPVSHPLTFHNPPSTVHTNLTQTTSITITQTATITTTVTSLTTTIAPPTCTNESKILGPTHPTCWYRQSCQSYLVGTVLSATTKSNEAQCFAACDALSKPYNVQCRGYTYYVRTQSCQLFSDIRNTIYVAGTNVNSLTWYYCY